MERLELNNIYLGDCYELIKLIPDNSIDLVYIDIPYLYFNGGKSCSQLSNNKLNNINEIKEFSNGIDLLILDELCRVLKKINIYIWCSKEQMFDIMNYFINKKDCNFNLLVWCKNNVIPTINNQWLSNLEYCLVFKEKGAPPYNNDYNIKSKYYVSSTNKYDKKLYDHPTIKPLNFVKNHILHSTQENDVVLDCFCGSGTTLVACKETNRNYIGIEINEKYYNNAINRLNGISQDGQTSIFTNFSAL